MIADPRFSGKPSQFWAYVRLISETVGYSLRVKRGQPKLLRRFTNDDVLECLRDRGLSVAPMTSGKDKPSSLLTSIVEYLNYRAEQLEKRVQPLLMDRKQAAAEFNKLRKALKPQCALPMNKQKKEKRHHLYLTGIVNMLAEQSLGGRTFDDEPRALPLFTDNGLAVRTLSRWMDGAYPSLTDPVAIWEIKEYYGTTTFGSRVADGVYETMLDGMELAELKRETKRAVLHYLIVDDRFTWWDKGRSYLCRIMDSLHAGLIDEVLFGREVLVRWPQIVAAWA